MKKMFTLALLLGIMAAAAAQSGPHQDGSFAPSQKGARATMVHASGIIQPTYTFTLRERNRAIARINRVYHRKIQREKNRVFVGRMEKIRRVNQLMRQRDFEIHKVNAKFNSPRNRYHYRNRHHGSRW